MWGERGGRQLFAQALAKVFYDMSYFYFVMKQHEYNYFRNLY